MIRLLLAALTLLVLLAIWSGAAQRRRFRDWVRAWDEVELEPWR